MELLTWKGAYCPCHVNPLSMRLFNHARGVQISAVSVAHHVACNLLSGACYSFLYVFSFSWSRHSAYIQLQNGIDDIIIIFEQGEKTYKKQRAEVMDTLRQNNEPGLDAFFGDKVCHYRDFTTRHASTLEWIGAHMSHRFSQSQSTCRIPRVLNNSDHLYPATVFWIYSMASPYVFWLLIICGQRYSFLCTALRDQ